MRKVLVILSISTIISACTSVGQNENAGKYAAFGAAGGAVVGNVIGGATGGDRTTSALMGAVVGAAFGGFLGHQKDMEAAAVLARDLKTSLPSAANPQIKAYLQKTSTGKDEHEFKEISAKLPADAVQARSNQVVTVVKKFTRFANTREHPMQLILSGKSRSDREFLFKAAEAEAGKGLPITIQRGSPAITVRAVDTAIAIQEKRA